MPPDVRRAIRNAARNIARVAARQIPKPLRCRGRAGRIGRAARRTAGARRLLRARRSFSASFVAADDRRAGACRRRARSHRRLPAPGTSGHGGGARSRRHPALPHRRRARDCGAGVRHRTVPRVDKIVGPGNRYVAAAKALVSADCAIDFYAGPTEIVVVAGERRPEVDRRRPDRAGRTRSRRALDLHHLERRLRRAREQGGRPTSRSRPRHRDASRWPHTARSSSRRMPTKRWRSRTASRPNTWSSIAKR